MKGAKKWTAYSISLSEDDSPARSEYTAIGQVYRAKGIELCNCILNGNIN